MTVVQMPDRREIRPGLYPGLSRAEYEAIPAINVSSLEHFERSPAHAREAMTHPPKPTDAMEFGTALHVALLEPSRFAAEYIGAPKVDRRTKEGKATWAQFEAEHANQIALDMDDFLTISRMRDAAYSHPIASKMLGGFGHNEVGVVFENEETGQVCKSLLDRISAFDGWTWVIDAKSCEDASRRGFSRSVKNYHYGAKAAFYLDGCNTVAPRERRFAWIAIEKKAPFAIAIYEPDGAAINAGRSKYMRWLRNYAEAVRDNLWPGYPAQIEALGSEDTEWRN